MSSSHRIIAAAVALSTVAFFVWRPWEPTSDPGTGQARRAGTAAHASNWLPGLPLPELRAGGKLALLVGIDDYPDPITDLRGCVEDVNLAAALLEARFGFEPEGIAVLRNEQATHENIVRAFDQWLIQRATPDTQVLIWFSGHGSLVPDVDDEGEQGDTDNTFLAWDSRKGHKGEYDLVDDEFHSLLAALTEVTPLVTVITDSCHSGTLMRGASVEGPRVRSIPEGENPVDPALIAGFWPAGVRRLDAGQDELDLTRYVHLAACSPKQLAFEHRYEDEEGEPKYQGALSFFLLDAMLRCDPDTSWGQLSEEVRIRVNSRYHSQEVWSEGALERQILGGGFEAPLQGFAGRVAGGLVMLEAGRVQRVYPGTKLDVYPMLGGARPQVLGQVIVEAARELTADAKWVGGVPASLEDGTPLRAVVVERVAGSQTLYVYADPPQLEDLLPTSVEVVSDALDADLFLTQGEGGELAVRDIHGDLIWASGRAFWNSVDGSLREQLADYLEKETAYRALVTLEEEPGRFALEACFAESTDPVQSKKYGSAHPIHVPATDSYRAQGSSQKTDPLLLELRVTNLEDFDLHVTVISLDEMRGRTLIYPGPNVGRDNVIAGGATKKIQVGLYVPESWDKQRPMRDRYLVIATREFADFSPLLGVRLRGVGGVSMPQPLRHALAGPVTRGMVSEKVQEPNWGILAVDVWVERYVH